jgi:hypothetical protein
MPSVKKHELKELKLQLQLILKSQSLRQQVAQFDQTDPEQLKTQIKALQERDAH